MRGKSRARRSGDIGYHGRGVHEFFEIFERMVFELLKVEMGFVTNRDAIAYYVCSFIESRGVQIIGYVDCFVVDTFNDLPM